MMLAQAVALGNYSGAFVTALIAAFSLAALVGYSRAVLRKVETDSAANRAFVEKHMEVHNALNVAIALQTDRHAELRGRFDRDHDKLNDLQLKVEQHRTLASVDRLLALAERVADAQEE